MLRIRLQRKGKKNQPFFRIVVTDKRNPPRGGRSLEILGFLNPLTKEKQLKIERIIYWLGVGAQPSDRIHNLLVSEGIIKDKKKSVHAKPKKKEGDDVAPEAGTVPTKPKADAGAKSEEKKEDVKAEEKPKEEPKKGEKKEDKKEDKPAEDKKADEPKAEKKKDKKEDKPKEKKE